MIKELKNTIKHPALCALCIAVLLPVGCERGGLAPDGRFSDADIVEKEVRIRMSQPEVADAALTAETKTFLNRYDTVGVTRDHMDGKWYEVGWKAGDKIYCYCQTGVYMDWTLTDDDMLHAAFIGKEAKTHVIYRVGDTWIACYCKGSKIGNYTGARTRDRIMFLNGVPREQAGTFGDCHICFGRAHPDDPDFEFENMQAYLRFEVTESAGGSRLGKLLDNYVTKITVQSLSDREKMAGTLEIYDDSGWRTTLQDSGRDEDRTITVKPAGGHFLPTGSTLSNYFVAIPARRYASGIRLNLWTTVGGVEAIRGYVDVPSVTLTRNDILNCHDLLKYCAIYVESISLKYGDIPRVEYSARTAGIEVMEGHTGTLVPTITPDSATNQSLRWESSDPGIVSVSADGSITGQEGKAGEWCWIRVFAKDREESEVARDSVKVTVRTDFDADGLGGYEQGTPDYWPY